jgi:SAM-dependent methyltransferase
VDWRKRAEKGFLASGIDPADRRGHKNHYIDLLQKMALEEVLELKGDETVLDFGCGSGRIAYWIAPRVRKVLGLDITPEMIELAERERTAENVEFMLYDGVHLPHLRTPMDLVLSIGVLQIMRSEKLKRTVSQLAQCLKMGGRMVLIEQVSDNPKVGRPQVQEYLESFEEAKLKCLKYYPIRKGRSVFLYCIRYGWIPESWFHRMAHHELMKRRKEKGSVFFYKDFLFLLEK